MAKAKSLCAVFAVSVLEPLPPPQPAANSRVPAASPADSLEAPLERYFPVSALGKKIDENICDTCLSAAISLNSDGGKCQLTRCLDQRCRLLQQTGHNIQFGALRTLQGS